MPDEAVVTVRRMAELCRLSRSRFYDLVQRGVFPQPLQHPASKRPMYDRELQNKCLEIRRTGIGANGDPVLFNRKPQKHIEPKQQVCRPAKGDDAAGSTTESILDALKGLGLNPTMSTVSHAIATLYPQGIVGFDIGDVTRKVFLYLQARK